MAGHSDNSLAPPVFDRPTKVLIVVAPYYSKIAEAQLAAARSVLERAGAAHESVEVPGALEIPPAISLASRLGDHDGFVALGCVIRGATSHYDVVVNESARGLTLLSISGVAVGNGIITVDGMEQAEERADGARLDTAGGAAEAALHLIALRRRWGGTRSTAGFRPFRGDGEDREFPA